MKFFSKKPAVCSICGQEKLIYKKVPGQGQRLSYCKECYDKYYNKIKIEVMQQVQDAIKQKKMIGIKEMRKVADDVITKIDNCGIDSVGKI